jgi:hypothetical protein
MSIKNAYDLNFASLAFDGHLITDYTDAADAIQVNPIGDRGVLVSGFSRSVYVKTSGRSVAVQISVMQNSEDSKFLQSRLKSQEDLPNHTPIQGFYKDNINGDTIQFINGWILTEPNYVRGSGHNPMTWTITFEREVRNLG